MSDPFLTIKITGRQWYWEYLVSNDNLLQKSWKHNQSFIESIHFSERLTSATIDASSYSSTENELLNDCIDYKYNKNFITNLTC